jgi:hypothetical protein
MSSTLPYHVPKVEKIVAGHNFEIMEPSTGVKISDG